MADIHKIATGLDVAKEKFGKGNEAVATAEERRQLAGEVLAIIISGIDRLLAIRVGDACGRMGITIARAHLEYREGVAAVSAVAYDSEHPAAQQAIASGRTACDSLLGTPVSSDIPHGNRNLLVLDSKVNELGMVLMNARDHAELVLESLAGLETDLQTAAAQGATAVTSTEAYHASIGAQ